MVVSIISADYHLLTILYIDKYMMFTPASIMGHWPRVTQTHTKYITISFQMLTQLVLPIYKNIKSGPAHNRSIWRSHHRDASKNHRPTHLAVALG